MNDAPIIVKIDLKTSVDDYIKQHLEVESSATTQRIHEVIREKKIMEDIKNKAKEKENDKDVEINDILNKLFEDKKIDKTETINRLINLEIVKNGSGATLKLKKLVEKKFPEFKLDNNKNDYLLVKL